MLFFFIFWYFFQFLVFKGRVPRLKSRLFSAFLRFTAAIVLKRSFLCLGRAAAPSPTLSRFQVGVGCRVERRESRSSPITDVPRAARPRALRRRSQGSKKIVRIFSCTVFFVNPYPGVHGKCRVLLIARA